MENLLESSHTPVIEGDRYYSGLLVVLRSCYVASPLSPLSLHSAGSYDRNKRSVYEGLDIILCIAVDSVDDFVYS